MDEFKKHSLLLTCLALLFVTKFIIVPVFAWQNQQLVDIGALQKKQYKISQLLTLQAENHNERDVLRDIVDKASVFFFPYEPESSFKISQQKRLEKLLDKYELKLQNIGWQTNRLMDEINATRYSLEVRFSGKTIDVIDFISALELDPQRVEITEFNLSLKAQREEQLGQVDGRLTLMLYVNSETPK